MPDAEKEMREKAEFEVAKKRLKECDVEAPYVFVSYKRGDWSSVYPIVEKIQERGYNVWIDKELIKKAGENWQDIVFDAMENPNCKKVLFFISEQSMTSAPVCAELLWSVSEYVRNTHREQALGLVPINIDVSGKLEKVQMGAWVQELSEKYFSRKLQDEDGRLLEGVISVKKNRINNLGRLARLIYERRFDSDSGKTFLNKEDIQSICDNLPAETRIAALTVKEDAKQPEREESQSKQAERKQPERKQPERKQSKSKQPAPKQPISKQPESGAGESMVPIKVFTEKFVKAMERNKAEYQKKNPGSKTPSIVFREIVLQMPWQSEKESITGQNWKPIFTAMLDSFYEFKGDDFFLESIGEAVKKGNAEPYVVDAKYYEEKIAANAKICKHYQKLTKADYYFRNWYGADALLGEMMKWIDRFNRFLESTDSSCGFKSDDYLIKFEVNPEFKEYFD